MKHLIKYGFLLIFILLSQKNVLPAVPSDTSGRTPPQFKRSQSVFPILMYDSDIGFGFGGKGTVRNYFHRKESFDLILFASTKGEQWYVFSFSIPDFEIRQGTVYPLALDVKLEFDKMLKSNFFGFGNDTRDNDWQFPREWAKLSLIFARGFTKQVVGEIGWLVNHSSVYQYEEVNPLLSPEVPGAGETLTSYITGRLRWDTRDSRINPTRGWKLGFTGDAAGKWLGSDFGFRRYRLEMSAYRKLFTAAHIFAFRLWLQQIEGTAPYFEHSIIGGGRTARGFKANRFTDRAYILTSAEHRFKLYRKLGGVLFSDAGRVFPGIEKAELRHWKANWGLGLRYYLANFVVRFDTGFSSEGTRIFFNFGHVF